MLTGFLESIGTPAAAGPDTGITQLTGEVLAGPGSGSVAAVVPGLHPPTQQNTAATGTVDNLDLLGHNVLLRCTNASLLTLTGFLVNGATPTTGDRVTIVGLSAQVNFTHQAGSTAANQLFNFVTSGPTPVLLGSASYTYDSTTARWRLIGHEQGMWITPTFAAGTYTAGGSQTFTVEEADVVTNAYYIKGHALHVMHEINTASIGGTPNSDLFIAFASTWTIARQSQFVVRVAQNNVTAYGRMIAVVGQSRVLVRNDLGATNWTASTNNAAINGELVAIID